MWGIEGQWIGVRQRPDGCIEWRLFCGRRGGGGGEYAQ